MGNNQVKQIAKKRLAICSSCSFNVKGICSKYKYELVNEKIVHGCNCPIEQKTYSMLSHCPKGLWLPEYNVI